MGSASTQAELSLDNLRSAMYFLVRLEMARDKHPHKDVEAALDYAEHHGWQVRRGGHWGFLYCPYNDRDCRCGTRCKAGIWSTPKNGSTHAKQLRQVVDGCTARQAGRDLSRNPDDDAASS